MRQRTTFMCISQEKIGSGGVSGSATVVKMMISILMVLLVLFL